MSLPVEMSIERWVDLLRAGGVESLEKVIAVVKTGPIVLPLPVPADGQDYLMIVSPEESEQIQAWWPQIEEAFYGSS